MRKIILSILIITPFSLNANENAKEKKIAKYVMENIQPKQDLHNIFYLCQRRKPCEPNWSKLCTSQRTTLLCCALIQASRPCVVCPTLCAQLCTQRFHACAQLRTRPAHNSAHNAPQPCTHNPCAQHTRGCAQRTCFP